MFAGEQLRAVVLADIGVFVCCNDAQLCGSSGGLYNEGGTGCVRVAADERLPAPAGFATCLSISGPKAAYFGGQHMPDVFDFSRADPL